MHVMAGALLALCLAGAASAEGERAGDFDYYVLSLSWSPTWCALEGDARRAPECAEGEGRGFTLHGLWPQHDEGWPSWCQGAGRDPSRAQSDAMEDIMGDGGLAWHQWKKHGRCSGLSGADYYRLMRRAYEAVEMPPVFGLIDMAMKVPATVVEDAFLEANPGLSRDQITVTCDEGMIQEVRLCLTRDLAPRRCGADVSRDCRLKDAVLAPLR